MSEQAAVGPADVGGPTPITESSEQREERHARESAELQHKLDEAKGAERDRLHVDFDKALREYEATQERRYVTWQGVQYEISPTAPARFVMFYLRECIEEVDGRAIFNVPDAKFARFLQLMLGDKLADAITDSDVPMGFVLQHVISGVFALWGLEFTPEQGAASAKKKPQTHG